MDIIEMGIRLNVMGIGLFIDIKTGRNMIMMDMTYLDMTKMATTKMDMI